MAAKKSKAPEKKIFTDSTFLVKRIYQPSKKRPTEDAVTYPFTRGIHPGMFRERFWTMRQYSGFGDAKLTNERFKIMLEKGQTGLSMAFDLPTQIGYDSDSPQAEGEVGKVGVSITSIKDMMMATPPLPDQTTIASILDKKNARIDALIEKDEKLIELLKEKRTALINHAVTKGLDPNAKLKDSGIDWIGEIPEGWEVVPLLKLLDSKIDYRGATPEKVDDGVCLVTGRNIKGGKIDYELSQECVPEDQYKEIMHRGLPRIGDLLFTTEAPLGEVANIDDEKVALAQRIIKMSGKKNMLDNYYLKYYIMTPLFQAHLQSYATGSTALGIKASNMCFLRLLVPKIKGQLRIVKNLDKATQKIDKNTKHKKRQK